MNSIAAVDWTAGGTMALAIVGSLAFVANVILVIITYKVVQATRAAAEATRDTATATKAAAQATQDEAEATREEAAASERVVEEMQRDRELRSAPYLTVFPSPRDSSASILNIGGGPAIGARLCRLDPGGQPWGSRLFHLGTGGSIPLGTVKVMPAYSDEYLRQNPTAFHWVNSVFADISPVGNDHRLALVCDDQTGNKHRFWVTPSRSESDMHRKDAPDPPGWSMWPTSDEAFYSVG